MAVAQTAYQNAKLNAERMKKMLENKAISQMQYENTQLALDAADTQAEERQGQPGPGGLHRQERLHESAFRRHHRRQEHGRGRHDQPHDGHGPEHPDPDGPLQGQDHGRRPGRGDRKDHDRPEMPGQDIVAPRRDVHAARSIPRTWPPTRSPRPSRWRSRSTTRR